MSLLRRVRFHLPVPPAALAWRGAGVLALLLGLLLQGGCGQPTWRDTLATDLPLYGHRNWIAIVDSAYPAQTRPGVETVVTNADQLEVLRTVLAALANTHHVKGRILVDSELSVVAESDAPGIEAYRTELGQVLSGADVKRMPHESIIAQLDKAGATFKILVLKSTFTLPYTSVFINLECGYWNAEAERRLREALKQHASSTKE